MSLIEIYNNTDNTHRQEMFYEYLKKSGLKESSYRQYAMTHPNNEAVRTVVKEVSKKCGPKSRIIWWDTRLEGDTYLRTGSVL